MVSVDGVLGQEAECFVKLLAEKIATKWKRSYPEIAGWIRSRLSFAILRVTNLCLRGSRTKWRSGAWYCQPIQYNILQWSNESVQYIVANTYQLTWLSTIDRGITYCSIGSCQVLLERRNVHSVSRYRRQKYYLSSQISALNFSGS